MSNVVQLPSDQSRHFDSVARSASPLRGATTAPSIQPDPAFFEDEAEEFWPSRRVAVLAIAFLSVLAWAAFLAAGAAIVRLLGL